MIVSVLSKSSRFFLTLVLAMALCHPRSARALESCLYAYYTPEAATVGFENRLPVEGISAVRPGVIQSPQLPNPNPPGQSWWLIRGNQLVGSMLFLQNVVTESSELIVADAHGVPLFDLSEVSFPCTTDVAPGLCQALNLRTAILPVVDGDMPFSLTKTSRGYFYKQYGNWTNPTSWRKGFEDSVEYAIKVMAETPDAVQIIADNPQSDLYLALASDPELAPYLPQVQIGERGGRFVITGRLPYEIESLMVTRAIDAGYSQIETDIVVDSAAWVPAPASERVANCFGEDGPGIRWWLSPARIPR